MSCYCRCFNQNLYPYEDEMEYCNMHGGRCWRHQPFISVPYYYSHRSYRNHPHYCHHPYRTEFYDYDEEDSKPAGKAKKSRSVNSLGYYVDEPPDQEAPKEETEEPKKEPNASKSKISSKNSLIKVEVKKKVASKKACNSQPKWK